MKIVLRIVAILVGLAVIANGLIIVAFALQGSGFGPFVRSGALGLITAAAWLIILTAGPIAAVQLWRLRRSGLLMTAALCGITIVYYLVGLVALRAPSASVRSIFGPIIINAVFLVVLLSPLARRNVS